MGKLTTATKFKLIKTLLTTIFVIIIVYFLMALFQAVIGDVLWKLISGYYMSDLPFLTSLIQVFIPAILIFFFLANFISSFGDRFTAYKATWF